MAIALKLLPAILVIAWLYWTLTAHRRTARQLRAKSEPLGDWRLMETAQRFAQTLGSGPFEVRIFELEQPNALALSTGEIYLSSGLYKAYLGGKAEREEAAAVIAHEIGHVALGHAQRRIETSRAQIAVFAVLGFLIGRALFGWWALLASVGLAAVNGRAAQRDEFEADAFAAQLMARAGYDPRATITMLEKVRDWGGGASDIPAPMRWFTTHPPVEERIAWLEQVIAAGPATPLGAPEESRAL
ncbi:MAG: M48 family metalloprotease [Pseudomonadota bacterium]